MPLRRKSKQDYEDEDRLAEVSRAEREPGVMRDCSLPQIRSLVKKAG